MTIAVDLGRKATIQTKETHNRYFTNSEELDEMPHNAAFHQRLQFVKVKRSFFCNNF